MKKDRITHPNPQNNHIHQAHCNCGFGQLYINQQNEMDSQIRSISSSWGVANQFNSEESRETSRLVGEYRGRNL